MNIDKAFKTLKEELLLEGKSWENFYDSLDKRLKNKIDDAVRRTRSIEDKDDILDGIKKVDPTATENNAGKYSEWLIKTNSPYILSAYATSDDEDRIDINVLKRFNEIQSNLENKDINQYKDLDDIKNATDKYESQKSTKKLKGKVDYQSGKYGIKKVDTSQESCELGKGTKWCITNKENFDDYKLNNDIFFLTDGNDKYAIVVSKDQNRSFQVYDDQDNKMGGLNFLYNNVPKEILDYIKKEVGK